MQNLFSRRPALLGAILAFVGISALPLLACLLPIEPAHAQTQYQFPTTPWGGFAPAVVECGVAKAVNANAATTDTAAIAISVPTSTYYIDKIWYSNASISLSTATAGVFTGAGGTGVTVVTDAALSGLTGQAVNVAASAISPTIASTTEAFNVGTLYFRIGTAQGAAATLDVRIYCRPAYG